MAAPILSYATAQSWPQKCGLCFVLGMVALNGAVEGVVTRFELELIFISFAVILPVLWATLLPGRLGILHYY